MNSIQYKEFSRKMKDNGFYETFREELMSIEKNNNYIQCLSVKELIHTVSFSSMENFVINRFHQIHR